MMMLKMVMMVETAHWNMGGVQVSLKAMKNRVILSVKMEFPAPFCEATTRDMYVSCSAAQSLRLSWFPTLAFLTRISFFPQFSFKCQQHLFKGDVYQCGSDSTQQNVTGKRRGENIKQKLITKKKKIKLDKNEIKNEIIFACGRFLTFSSFAVAGLV